MKREKLYQPLLKIKARMVELGYTQEDLANKMNMSKPSINEKLNGNADLKFTEIVRLTKILGIAPDEIETYFFDNELRKA